MSKKDTKELSIQINLNGLSFCIINTLTNTLEYLNSITFESKLSPFNTLNRLKAELSTNTVFSQDFVAVHVIHQNELSTFVPKALYSENHKVDYLKFNSKILKSDFITEDNITANNTVNIYIPYVNINNYIFDTFGEFEYKHASTIFLESLLKLNTSEENTPQVYINVNHNTFEIVVLKNNNLKLYNTFEYFSKEDFIYYILFVFEQLQLDVETSPIYLSGSIDKDNALFNIIYTYIRHVKFMDCNFNFKLTDNTPKDTLHHYYVILNSF